MILAYFNYPNVRITLHADMACSEIEKAGKIGQRHLKITDDTLQQVLSELNNKNFRLGSTVEVNDFWLTIHLENRITEEAVLGRVRALIAGRYARMLNVSPTTHC